MVREPLKRRDIEVNIVTKGGYTALRLAEVRGFRQVAHVLVADERVDIGWGDDNLRAVRLYRWMCPLEEPDRIPGPHPGSCRATGDPRTLSLVVLLYMILRG